MSTLSYRADIDVLRALAVVSVVLFHGFIGIFPNGYLGVDVFFVISGYLITLILLKQVEQGPFIIVAIKFWTARIRRLFPSLLFMLFVALFLGYVFLFPFEFEALNLHALRSLVYWQNFGLIDEIDYFDEDAIRKPLLHLWSLSVEEHFYVFWPFLLFTVIVRYGRNTSMLLYATFFIFLTSFLYGNYLYLYDTQVQFYHSLGRFWELSIGAMVALLPKRTQRSQYHYVFVVLLVSVLFIPLNFNYVPLLQLICCLITGVVVYCGFSASQLKSFIYIGKISYPLYLFHWMFFSFGEILLPNSLAKPVFVMVMIVSAVVFAIFSYHVVERLRFSINGLRNILILYGMMFAFVVLGYFGQVPAFSTAEYSKYILQTQRMPSHDEICQKYVSTQIEEIKFNYCRAHIIEGQPIVALVGDSHAHALYPGFLAEAKEKGFSAILLANSSCPTLVDFKWFNEDVSAKACQEKIAQIIDVINGDKQIKKVIMLTRGPVYIHGETERLFTEDNISKTLQNYKNKVLYNYETYGNGLTKFWSSLKYVDAQNRFYMLENPELDFKPRDVLPRTFLEREYILVSRSLYDLRMGRYNEIVRQQAGGGLFTILDPSEVLCNDIECQFFDEKFLYSDDDHLSAWGSRKVMAHFAPRVFDGK